MLSVPLFTKAENKSIAVLALTAQPLSSLYNQISGGVQMRFLTPKIHSQKWVDGHHFNNPLEHLGEETISNCSNDFRFCNPQQFNF